MRVSIIQTNDVIHLCGLPAINDWEMRITVKLGMKSVIRLGDVISLGQWRQSVRSTLDVFTSP